MLSFCDTAQACSHWRVPPDVVTSFQLCLESGAIHNQLHFSVPVSQSGERVTRRQGRVALTIEWAPSMEVDARVACNTDFRQAELSLNRSS